MPEQHKEAADDGPGVAKDPRPDNNDFMAKPRGDIDVDALYEEVARKYPNVIARLAE